MKFFPALIGDSSVPLIDTPSSRRAQILRQISILIKEWKCNTLGILNLILAWTLRQNP